MKEVRSQQASVQSANAFRLECKRVEQDAGILEANRQKCHYQAMFI
jgi:hypothetical protein